MKPYVYSLGATLLLGCCMPALAQGYYASPVAGPDYTPANWYFAGGYTVATGEAANFVNNGWNFGGGAQWRSARPAVAERISRGRLTSPPRDFAYYNERTRQRAFRGRR